MVEQRVDMFREVFAGDQNRGSNVKFEDVPVKMREVPKRQEGPRFGGDSSQKHVVCRPFHGD